LSEWALAGREREAERGFGIDGGIREHGREPGRLESIGNTRDKCFDGHVSRCRRLERQE
jgi:hypothetical protein